MRRHDDAIAACERAITLDPNFSAAHALFAQNLTFAGRAEEAIVPIQTALRLDPKPQYMIFLRLGMVYYHNGMYEEALSAYKKGLEVSPNAPTLHWRLACAYSALRREKEARGEIDEVRRLAPKLSIAYLSKMWPYKNPADLEQVLNDLRKAGMK
jgi:adenylate cyclase